MLNGLPCRRFALSRMLLVVHVVCHTQEAVISARDVQSHRHRHYWHACCCITYHFYFIQCSDAQYL